MTIDLGVFELYLKNGSELLWVDDPARFPRPTGTSLQTDEMFVTLSRTEDILAQLASRYFSDELTNEMVAELLNLEQQMMAEVFDKLLSIHGLTKETHYNQVDGHKPTVRLTSRPPHTTVPRIKCGAGCTGLVYGGPGVPVH